MGDTLLNMHDRSLMDVSNHKIGACSLEDTDVIKTEPEEYDEQENVKEKGPEDVSVKIETENREEDGLEHVSDITGTETNQDNISDLIKVESMEENGLETVSNKPRTQNKEENKQKDVMVDIKTEQMDKDENEHVKTITTNTEKHGRIDSVAMDAKAEFDLEEQVIVMNEKTKFRNRVKPDTSTYSHFCQTCDMAFRWPQQLRNHIRFVHEGDFPYTCKICGKGFEHLKSFRDHKYVHTEERPHCCKLCPSRFKMRGGLNKHMRDIHEENKLKFKCEHCSKVFKCKEKLISHFVVHQSEKQFACEICGKKFNRKPNLKDHLVTHSKEKNFECTECGMKFNRKYAMKIHRRNHLEVRPYKCDFCDKSFSQSHALKSHVRLHTGERPYKCQYCDRAFKQLGTWQIHEKRHRGEKDFVCGVCGRAFLIHRRLTEHMRTHTGEKPYKCSLCPYRGATSTGLKYHERTHERRLLREFKKALEAEMKENETDFTTESVSKDTREAMRAGLSKEFDNEVKKKSGQAIKSKTKVKRNTDNVTNVKVEKPDDLQPVKKTKRKTKHIIEKIVEDGVKRAPTMKKIKKDQKNKKNQELLGNSLFKMSENRNSLPPLGQNSSILLLTLAKDDKESANVQVVKDEKQESSFIDLFQKNMETSRNKTTQLVLFDDTFSNGYTQNATELPNGAMHNGLDNGTSMIDEAIKNLADSIRRDCHGKRKVNGAPGGYGSKNGTQGTCISLFNNTCDSKIEVPGISFLGNRYNHGAPNISLLSNNFGSRMSNDAPDIKPFHQTDVIELSSSSDSESDEKDDDVKFENMDGCVIQEDNDPTFGAKDTALMDSDSERETSDGLNVKAENCVITEHDLVNNDSEREETWNGLGVDADELANTEHSDVEHSDTVVAETEDFIIVRNDSVSPFEH